jgi:hypothetical protein
MTDIDTTAADMLVELDEELNATGKHLIFAELKDPVKDKIVLRSAGNHSSTPLLDH